MFGTDPNTVHSNASIPRVRHVKNAVFRPNTGAGDYVRLDDAATGGQDLAAHAARRVKLAILSDTHGLLRPEVAARLKSADVILHGGDINRQDIVDELGRYAPVYIVRGNNDKEWAEEIPHHLTVTLGGVTFFLIHNKKELPASLDGVNVVVFGHSHKYTQEERDGILWLNPGSCGPRRFHQEITMMMAEAADGTLRVEKITIPHGEK